MAIKKLVEVWDGKDFVEAWNTVEIYTHNQFPTELIRRVERRSI